MKIPMHSSYDAHLLFGSPAINAGIATLATDDFDRVVRTGNPDIGAYEYVSETSVTPATLKTPIFKNISCYSIYDIRGQKVVTMSSTEIKNRNFVLIYRSGVYFVVDDQSGGSFVKKIVVMK